MNHKRVKTDLIFSKLEDGTVEPFLLLAVADSAYHVASGGNCSLGNFTGSFSFFDLDFNHKKSILVRNGVPTAGTDTMSTKIDGVVVPRSCEMVEVVVQLQCPQAFSSALCSRSFFFWVCDHIPGGNTVNGAGTGGAGWTGTAPGTSGGFSSGVSSGGGDSGIRIGVGGFTTNWDWWKGDANTTWLDALLQGVPLDVFREWNANSGYTNTLTDYAAQVYELAQTMGLTNPAHIAFLIGRPDLVEAISSVWQEYSMAIEDAEKTKFRLHFARVIDFVRTAGLKTTDGEIMMLFFEDPRIFTTLQKIYTEGNGDTETKAFIKKMLQGLTTDPDPQAIRNLIDLDQKISLTKAQFQWLFDHKTFINQHLDYLSNNNSHSLEVKKEAIKVNLHFLTTDPEYAALTTSMASWPGWAWEIFAEVMVEVGARIVKKQLGLDIGDDVKDAIKTCAGGEVLECIGNVIDVLRRFFPALKFIDLGLDTIEFGGKAKDVWKAIDKITDFGEDFSLKVTSLIKSKTGGLLDSVKYKNQNTGIELTGIGDPNSFWNSFKAMFPDITGPHPNPIETYKVLGNTIEIQYYATSGTTGGPTIKASINGYVIKFRLQ
jgi:hypothetical protein